MKFYRYEIEQDISGPHPVYKLKELIIEGVKETPKGYWLDTYPRKWISKESKKRHAYPTKEEALLNFTKRMEKYKNILEVNLEACRQGLKLAESITK